MRIYFDNAASTPIRSEVSQFLKSSDVEGFYNPSSVHQEGQKSKSKINQAREYISDILNCETDNILFTSSGTEACNYIISHALHTYDVKNIIYLETEHSAVIDTINSNKAKKIKCKITKDGLIDLLHLEERFKTLSGKSLVCAMLINNETGILQPIEDISRLCKKYNSLFFSDMIQAVGKVNLQQSVSHTDFASFASHKIGGLHGVGLVYMRDSQPVFKQVFGGEQEFGRKAGTENVIGIAAFQVALEACMSKMSTESQNNKQLHEMLIKGVGQISNNIEIPSLGANKDDSISTLIFPGLKSENLIIGLDIEGIAVSAGAACSSGKIGGSHVLRALNYNENQMNSAIRVSFGWHNYPEQVDFFLKTLNNTLQGMNFNF